MTKERLEDIIEKAKPILKPANVKSFEVRVEDPKDGIFPIRLEFLITDKEWRMIEGNKNLKFANYVFSNNIKENLLNYFDVEVSIKSSKLTKIGQL